MAQQTIGIGTAANDGTGDQLRSAFTKVNANFTEVYAVTTDADIAAIAALSATAGMLSRTGAGAFAARTITGTSPVQVSGGTGASGNPTISVDAATTSASGIVELATSGETTTGTDTVRATTPAGVKAVSDLLLPLLGGTMTGLLKLPGVYTDSKSILDDAVGDYGDLAPNGFILIIGWRTNFSAALDVFAALVRTSVSPGSSLISGFGTQTNLAASTSTVTGTTGVDGKITISATSGSLKIENRSGGSLTLALAALRSI